MGHTQTIQRKNNRIVKELISKNYIQSRTNICCLGNNCRPYFQTPLC